MWYIFYVFENKYFTVKSYKNIDHDTAVTMETMARTLTREFHSKSEYCTNIDHSVLTTLTRIRTLQSQSQYYTNIDSNVAED